MALLVAETRECLEDFICGLLAQVHCLWVSAAVLTEHHRVPVRAPDYINLNLRVLLCEGTKKLANELPGAGAAASVLAVPNGQALELPHAARAHFLG